MSSSHPNHCLLGFGLSPSIPNVKDASPWAPWGGVTAGGPEEAREEVPFLAVFGFGSQGGRKPASEALHVRHSQALGAVFDHSPIAPPIVHPVKVCLAAVVKGGYGLSRPGGNLGFRVF